MSIQTKVKTVNGKSIIYYYPVISTYKYDKSKTPLWGPGFLKKKDAILEESRMKAALEKTPFANRIRGIISFEEVKNAWLQTRISKELVTAERDRSFCDLYLSVFDDMDIRKITAIDIQDWITLLSQKYAPKTINMAFNLMSQIMNYAINPLKIIKENPCLENIQKPKLRHRGVESEKYWTEKELKFFLTHQLTINDSYYRLYLIHATFGMRPGEICGLSVNDIDLDNRRITLNHGLDKKNRLTNLKNSGAQRTLRIPQRLIEPFKEQIAHSNTLRSKNEKYPYLFVSNDGTSVNPDVYRKHLQRLIKRINNNSEQQIKSITPYGLRHTFATLSLLKGIHIKAVAEIMGDSVDTVMTNYVHILEQLAGDSLEMIADNLLD